VIIQLNNVTKSYTNSLGQINRQVLSDLNMQVGKGERIAIMGPSGSGKTSLLNLIASFDKPDSGSVIVKDQELYEMTQDDILKYRNRSLGFVFQFHHLLPQCSLFENVLIPTLTDKKNRQTYSENAENILKFMGVWEQCHNKPAELSGGECQRAAVARALINNPEILLADEPTGSLDEENANLLIELLVDISKTKEITLIIATHSLEIASKMDKIYRISDGKLVI
jgi:lipoprotein-releasing system ATP-binding protein